MKLVEKPATKPFNNILQAKLAGVESFGMVLCAAKGEEDRQVEFLEPPAEAAPGAKIIFEGLEPDPKSY